MTKPVASAPPSAPTPTTPAAPTASTPPALDMTAAQHAALDVTEHGSAIDLPVLFAKTEPKASFPKATVGDRDCWQGLSVTGDHKKDFDAIIARCGTPTGMREYVKAAKGRLHHVHDKRDTYKIKLAGAFCYRFYAVADAKISDLDILIETPTGALVGDDKSKQPIAIIETDKAWCLDDDKEYQFQVEIDGVGDGFYMFGVWARPKK